MDNRQTENRKTTLTESHIDRYDDAYGEGFADGRKSMAKSVVLRLLETHEDEAIAEITGLNKDEIANIRNPNADRQNPDSGNSTEKDEFTLLRENPVLGTMYVEPTFVKLVRTLHEKTQAAFAKKLDVHPDTVSTWETADIPIRMKTLTYEKILAMYESKRGRVST
ncbi:MAG: helix-turn-helix transcriptional regulator [Lentisphaerae bacterium]|jgi:DNA-binding transcriptional regulator YiaG|nr:helix-turn-helix transcriptional regulator [Lentisphaerota bacterium]